MKKAEANQKQPLLPYAIALAVVVFFTALLYLCFPFRLDLNDDVVMKDILSGAYTGVPDGHNIQMQYPLGVVLALLYRLVPALPWYGLFLVITQTTCLALVLGTVLATEKDRKAKGWSAVFFVALAAALFLPHMVFYQYTVTCALLSGTAAFLLYTKRGVANDILSLALLLLAFLVRSEMMLLTCPMVALALLFRVVRDRNARNNTDDTEWLRGNIAFVILLIAGLSFCAVTHAAGYGSDKWKTFVTLFDNRTELYDFHRLPSYEEHEEFYQSIGLKQSEHTLLENYNYGLDESIDKDTLGALAGYAASVERQEKTGRTLAESVKQYLYRLRHFGAPAGYAFPQSDMPWNLMTILCYLLWVFQEKEIRRLWKPLLLFLCRSSLWLFILMRGRDPVRITHGLYLVELLIISSVIIINRTAPADGEPRTGDKITKALVIVIPILSLLLCFGSTTRITADEIATRTETEKTFHALYNYMDEHPDSFYFMDVYTWVPYTEHLLQANGMRPANRDICGGWACKSPVYEEKLSAFSFSGMQDALLTENVFFVQRTDRDTDWLVTFYKDCGIDITVEETERISGLFSVYTVREG